MKSILAASILLLSGQAFAAMTPFYVEKHLTTQFPMGVGEIQSSSFGVLNAITLTQLGTTIDPTSISVYEWRIYTNDVALPDIPLSEGTSITFVGLDFDIYNIEVDHYLQSAPYAFELRQLTGEASMRRYNDSSPCTFPIGTSDYKFEIISEFTRPNTNTFDSRDIPSAFSVSLSSVLIPASSSFSASPWAGCYDLASTGRLPHQI